MNAADVVVFVGPTLYSDTPTDVLAAEYLPPASQGDVYGAVRRGVRAIGLIDGYFERVPAVWHKEILWALTHGVRVYGSASMGALRAAELHAYGMRGTGSIFEDFLAGTLVDDDEVTIVHSSIESGYRPLSDAMVNIRATMRAAVLASVVSERTATDLCDHAKACFYPDRRLESSIDAMRRGAVAQHELDALVAWLPLHRVDQKRLDALDMLELMADDERAPEPHIPGFRFQHTDAWDQVVRQIDRRLLSSDEAAASFPHDAVIDELRLRPDHFHDLRREALVRRMAIEIARLTGDEAGDLAISAAVEARRIESGLFDADSVESWLEDQELTVRRFTELVIDDARVARQEAIFGGRMDDTITDLLRLHGSFADVARRAREKHETLVAGGLENPTRADAGLVSDDELWRWYFEDRLGREVPADLEDVARALGYLDVFAMRRTVLREFCYVRLGGATRIDAP